MIIGTISVIIYRGKIYPTVYTGTEIERKIYFPVFWIPVPIIESEFWSVIHFPVTNREIPIKSITIKILVTCITNNYLFGISYTQ